MKGYLIALAVFLLAGAAVWQQQKIIDQQALQVEDLTKVANDSGRLAKTYRNLFGNEVSKNNLLRMDVKTVQDLRKTSELKWLEKFEGLKKNASNLESASRIDAVAEFDLTGWVDSTLFLRDPTVSITEGATNVTKYDVYIPVFSYSDKYNSITGSIKGTLDSVKIKGIIVAPIKGAVYWQRRKVLWMRIGKKNYFSEFLCENDWVHITNHEEIQVRKRR
jgi:hypothetical protein